MPRSQAGHERRKSSRLRMVRPSSGMTVSVAPPRSAIWKTSPIANSATTTMTTSRPSSSVGMPKVSRDWPLWLSMPTSPIASPISRLPRPLSGEDPSRVATVTKAIAIRPA